MNIKNMTFGLVVVVAAFVGSIGSASAWYGAGYGGWSRSGLGLRCHVYAPSYKAAPNSYVYGETISFSGAVSNDHNVNISTGLHTLIYRLRGFNAPTTTESTLFTNYHDFTGTQTLVSTDVGNSQVIPAGKDVLYQTSEHVLYPGYYRIALVEDGAENGSNDVDHFLCEGYVRVVEGL